MSIAAFSRQHPTWAVLGGGNGGQSLAGYLALKGFSVRLYDIFQETINAINDQGGIRLEGSVQGLGKLSLATTDISQALAGADIVMVVAPALAHSDIASSCAPYLADGQLVFLHPGATGGCLAFKQVLDRSGVTARVTLAEANSLLYACRCPQAGQATVLGVKRALTVAALPATENSRALAMLNTAFPQMRAGSNVLETSLANPNAIMHPAPTLLNTSMIESGRDWLYYWDGITPSIGAFVEALDRERLMVGQAFGLDLAAICQWYKEAYNANGDTLCEAVKNNPAYSGVKGQSTLRTRYLLEDIPMGLVPMAALAAAAGVDVPMINLVIQLGECLVGGNLTAKARTLEALGLAGKSVDDILRLVNTGTL